MILGSMVMANLWCDICHVYSHLASTFCRAILHDPTVFPEPDSFKPERFINPDGSLRDDPVVSTIFGFGKRICPGRHLADAMMFIVIASFLSVFDIKKGNDINEGPDTYPYTGTGVRCGHHLIGGAGDSESRPLTFSC
jgi:cytochrome P450